ncbi:MAG: glycoside hydrolase family 43 protein [Flavisolibacter sp.]|nr:glycoside hydrolase family 43 protein [Flavisolibacter sp.]MBD0351619.1 glycoside hydrolase family 43 protein [Flavisolibacter sp.]
MHLRFLIAVLLFVGCDKNSNNNNERTSRPPVTSNTTFTNPLLPSGPDPWVVQKDTTYYYTHTFGDRIVVFKTNKMSELNRATTTTIWSPPSNTAYSREIWAPELHFINGKWYAYFAADDGQNKNHRMYVLENASADPLSGTWEFKGKVADPSDKWAIDGSVFEYNGQLYFIWSGWEGDINVRQNIYIAKMDNPWTITGNRVMLSTPTYDWEKNGDPDVNEGPEALKNRSGKLFLTYSASGCWTDNYALGLLSLKAGGDPMNPADWTKSPTPVFTTKASNGAYGPGHNGSFKSRDGSEDWIIYHANSQPGQGCGDFRNPRMQKFTWNADGTPNFGEPVKINTKIQKPSGE